MKPAIGDDVTVMGAYGGDQRPDPAKVEKVLDVGNEWPLLTVAGRAFHRHRTCGYIGTAPDGAPLTLVLPGPR